MAKPVYLERGLKSKHISAVFTLFCFVAESGKQHIPVNHN